MSNKDTNVVIVNDKSLGRFSVIMSSAQLKKLVKNGAKVLEQARKNETDGDNKPVITLGRKPRRGPSAPYTGTDGGFIGNTVDWGALFPDNSNVDELIRKAKEFEDKFAIAMDALVAFIGVGLSGGLGGIALENIDKQQVESVIGPFMELYALE